MARTDSRQTTAPTTAAHGGASGSYALARVVTATLLTQALASWCVLMLPAIAPIVAESFGLSPVLIGYQIAIIYCVGTAVSLVAGGLVTRWGACRVSQVALVACALGGLIALLPALPAIALASAAIGFAYGLTNPSAAHLLAKYTPPQHRSLVFSIKQTGVPLGGMAAGLLTPWIAVVWGWQAAISVVIPATLILAAALAPARESWDADRNPRAPVGTSALVGMRRVFAQPALRWLSFCGFCFASIQLCLMTFVVSFAVAELAFGAVLAGGLLAAAQASGVGGRLVSGYVADRVGRNALVLLIIGLVTAGACLALWTLDAATVPWVVFGVAIVFGASAIGWNGVFMAEVVRFSPPSMVGTAIGVATFSTFSGVLMGPLVFVQLYGWLGSYASVFGLLTVPALLGSLGAAMTAREGALATRLHR